MSMAYPDDSTVLVIFNFSNIVEMSSEAEGRDLGLGVKHLLTRSSRKLEYT